MNLESRYADMALRLLLPAQGIGPCDGVRAGDLADVDWDVILQLVQKNLITIRTFEALRELGVAVPHEAYGDMVEREQLRIGRTMELIGRISEILEGEGMEFVFTKSFQHYPDMGHDVDLFVLDGSAKADVLITSSFRTSISKESLSHKLAGKQGYEIDGYPSPVEIHHGRLGHVGEHNLYPQVLMRDGVRAGDLADVDWDVILQLVQKNLITIRTFEALRELGVAVPHEAYGDMVEREQLRIGRTMELIGRISEILEGEGMEFVFTKSFQHYPDMGHDVDLFVLDGSAKADVLITSSFRTSISKESLSHKLAGKQGYEIDGYPSPVEIHHGRLGHVGEHNLYPQVLMRNRQQVTVDGITTFIASREDQLIVQAMQRIYSHLYIRLSDVVHTVSAIRRGDLDWDYVVGTAKRIGIFDGLSCYVSYVNQIYSRLFQTDVVSPEIGKLLVRGGVGKVRFKGWHYHFPIVLTVSRVYSRQFFATVGSLNWEGAARLCLLPPLTALAGFRILARTGARISRLRAFGSSRVDGGV